MTYSNQTPLAGLLSKATFLLDISIRLSIDFKILLIQKWQKTTQSKIDCFHLDPCGAQSEYKTPSEVTSPPSCIS